MPQEPGRAHAASMVAPVHSTNLSIRSSTRDQGAGLHDEHAAAAPAIQPSASLAGPRLPA